MPTRYRNELHELFEKFGSDKGLHGYDVPYTLLFDRLRNAPLRILEIGVAEGASLRTWEAFFPGATIQAIDIEPERARFASSRSQVFICDQGDRDELQRLAAEAGGWWDIVIDDGGHHMYQHQTSLEILWPHVKPGGFYAIEDLNTCWSPIFNQDHRTTTANLILREAEDSFQNAVNTTRRQILVSTNLAVLIKPEW